MLSILCLSRFDKNCQGRQRYDPHIPPTVGTVGATSVSCSFYRTGSSFKIVATSYGHLATRVSVAWVSNSDDFRFVEVEKCGEPISWYSSGVFRCVCIVPTNGGAVAICRSGDSSFGYADSPFTCMVFLELLRLWIRIWKRSQHQVLPWRHSRISCQRRLLCVSVCCDWIDRVEGTTRDYFATRTFLNHWTNNA